MTQLDDPSILWLQVHFLVDHRLVGSTSAGAVDGCLSVNVAYSCCSTVLFGRILVANNRACGRSERLCGDHRFVDSTCASAVDGCLSVHVDYRCCSTVLFLDRLLDQAREDVRMAFVHEYYRVCMAGSNEIREN